MSFGSIRERWTRGVDWTWIDERYRACLPDDLALTVMKIQSGDRYHAKQGRSTARVVFHPAGGRVPAKGGGVSHAASGGGEMPAVASADRPLAVYLKRHFRLPWPARVAALFDPAGKHSPAAAEWAHLERVRAMGIDVPEVVAAGERIGPRAGLQSFLMIAELGGCEPLNESLPGLASRLDARAFASLKRRMIAEMARITATLHAAGAFHKDLYLCHFFLDRRGIEPGDRPLRLILIDLHRLGEHRLWPDWWRWKDLGQLLFSTYGVVGIDDRDRLRFWKSYVRLVGIHQPALHGRMIRLRAARYLAHNRKSR